MKADGSLAAAGEPGELYVSSPSLALGYYNDDAAYVVHLVHTSTCCRLIQSTDRTRDVFINEYVHTFQFRDGNHLTLVNRWVKTGDQVLISPEGELYILDRIKEMIKVKAFQVGE